jgi:Thaumatin family
MNILKKSLQIVALLLLPVCILFAKNPIKAIQTQHFPDVVIVSGGTYVASYTFMSEMPFTMIDPLTIEKKSNSPSDFTYDDSCTGKKLTYLEICDVLIYLNPTSAGIKTVELTEAYGHDRVPLPTLSSQATGTSVGTNVSGITTTELTDPLGVNQSSPWKFTFTNNGASAATGVNLSLSVSGFNTTCGSTLPGIADYPNNSCYVQGTYTAQSTADFTITATFSYAQGAPIILQTSTSGSGASSGLVCTPAVPFAPQTQINTTTPITLLCTNKTGASITITGHTSTYPTGGANGNFVIPGPGDDNCGNSPLGNGNSCQLNGTYQAPGAPASNVTISESVTYNTGTTTGLVSETHTSTNIVTTITNKRIIHLVNQCNFPVWWSMVGGATSNSPACTSDAQCNKGSTCNIGAKLCYYNNYGPTSGSYKLDAVGGTVTATTQIIQTEASTTSDHILWKGLIAASTQCTPGASCLNNDCNRNGGSSSCFPGTGFDQPSTEAEFTLELTGSGHVDSYDISNVNGFSMPISMSTNQTADVYFCGNAGNNVAATGLNACDFSHVTPPTNMYYWVSNITSCTSSNTCTDGGQICGLAFSTTANNFVKACGDFLGYWSADQICGVNSNFSSPFGDNFACNQYLSTPFPQNTYTLTQLLKCSPPDSTAPLFNSCYLSYPGSSAAEKTQCCGCTNWDGIATPSTQCPAGQTDPQWTKYVEKIITWMKEACPTSYVYPYDDKASSFTCTADETTEYTITFCPGTGTGLPATKTDGR